VTHFASPGVPLDAPVYFCVLGVSRQKKHKRAGYSDSNEVCPPKHARLAAASADRQQQSRSVKMSRSSTHSR